MTRRIAGRGPALIAAAVAVAVVAIAGATLLRGGHRFKAHAHAPALAPPSRFLDRKPPPGMNPPSRLPPDILSGSSGAPSSTGASVPVTDAAPHRQFAALRDGGAEMPGSSDAFGLAPYWQCGTAQTASDGNLYVQCERDYLVVGGGMSAKDEYWYWVGGDGGWYIVARRYCNIDQNYCTAWTQ